MDLFHIIDEGAVILYSRGVYSQRKVYRRGDGVYAQFGGGFVRLHGSCGTSCPKVSWRDIDAKGVQRETGYKPLVWKEAK